MLYIKIKNLTKSIDDCEWFSKNDLFIKLQYGNQHRRTEIKWNDNNPIWNEIFIFEYIQNEYIQNEYIQIQICDENSWSPNAILVETMLPIKNKEIMAYTNKYIEYDMGDPIYHYNTKIQNLLECNYELNNKYDEVLKQNDIIQKNADIKYNELMKKYDNARQKLDNINKILVGVINDFQCD